MRPVGRYGVHRQVTGAALWVGCAALVVACAVLAAALWVIRTVGWWAWVLALGTQDRIAELDLVMDVPLLADAAAGPGGVVEGVVVSVPYEETGGYEAHR
jgi:hypothetical protein